MDQEYNGVLMQEIDIRLINLIVILVGRQRKIQINNGYNLKIKKSYGTQ